MHPGNTAASIFLATRVDGAKARPRHSSLHHYPRTGSQRRLGRRGRRGAPWLPCAIWPATQRHDPAGVLGAAMRRELGVPRRRVAALRPNVTWGEKSYCAVIPPPVVSQSVLKLHGIRTSQARLRITAELLHNSDCSLKCCNLRAILSCRTTAAFEWRLASTPLAASVGEAWPDGAGSGPNYFRSEVIPHRCEKNWRTDFLPSSGLIPARRRRQSWRRWSGSTARGATTRSRSRRVSGNEGKQDTNLPHSATTHPIP